MASANRLFSTNSFMAGYNFFIYEALLIPFEITALSTVLDFWSDDIPPWAIPLACIVSSPIAPLLLSRLTGLADSLWVSFPVRPISNATLFPSDTSRRQPKRLFSSFLFPKRLFVLILPPSVSDLLLSPQATWTSFRCFMHCLMRLVPVRLSCIPALRRALAV